MIDMCTAACWQEGTACCRHHCRVRGAGAVLGCSLTVVLLGANGQSCDLTVMGCRMACAHSYRMALR